MTKYIQREDGEGFVVPLDETYRLACCDCGLVHDVVWSYDKKTKELGMAVKRNNRATAQRRKNKGLEVKRRCKKCNCLISFDGTCGCYED
jgi:hypothetical protein